MKKILNLFIALLMGISASMAQESLKEKEVPKPVIEAFKGEHSDVEKVRWEKYKGRYQAVFSVEKKETTIAYDRTGKLYSTQKQVDKTELPTGCESYLNEKFEKTKILDVLNININDSIVYSVAMKCKKGDYEIFFDKDGKYLKKKSYN
ncbi:MAG: PepSY-like domain-containing protein [Bacteroidetes bacterium]|nr:PepSY-like domain-containing protein [Bacteroidota bacterium]